MTQTVTTTFLEITAPGDLRPAREPALPFVVTRVERPDPGLNRSLYAAVGAAWAWRDRLRWDDERWLAYVHRAELETWVGSVSGERAGYFELERQEDSVEIAYFGLLPAFIGHGLGGVLLTQAIRRGFDRGARRVWLHTCNRDHPQAIANYLARGMRVYRIEHSGGAREST